MKQMQLGDLFRDNKSIMEHLIDLSVNQEAKVKFGKYSIVKYLGKGSFARVYKAIDTHKQKTVALKIIDLEELQQKFHGRQFLNKVKKYLQTEEENMRKCKSAFIIKIYESFTNQKCKVIVLEYCNGDTLEHLIKKRGGIDEGDAISLLRQIICGLAEMHRNRIIHRDLKPANILIHNGVLKIADLGLSKKIPVDQQKGEHTAVGTRSTMAPEVSRLQPYGLKADIWSLGIIFFLMINYDKELTLIQNYQMVYKFIENKKKNNFSTYVDKFSHEALDFLIKTLEVDQSKRINWQQTLSHPLFFKFTQQLPQFFNPYQEKGFQQLKDMKQFEENMFEINQNEQFQEKSSFEEEQNFKINPQDQNDNSLLCRQYFECRKAEFILKNLIIPLIQKHMLDIKQQKHIEMLYLLTARCKINISSAIDKVKQKYSEQLSTIFTKQLQRLSQRVQIQFERVSDLLTEQQNKFKSIIKEKMIKLVNKKSFNDRNRFLGGIQGTNYTREEQVTFTISNYIVDLINQVRGNQKDEQRVKAILKSYREIVLLQQSNLQGFSFQVFVDKKIKSQIE